MSLDGLARYGVGQRLLDLLLAGVDLHLAHGDSVRVLRVVPELGGARFTLASFLGAQLPLAGAAAGMLAGAVVLIVPRRAVPAPGHAPVRGGEAR